MKNGVYRHKVRAQVARKMDWVLIMCVETGLECCVFPLPFDPLALPLKHHESQRHFTPPHTTTQAWSYGTRDGKYGRAKARNQRGRVPAPALLRQARIFPSGE